MGVHKGTTDWPTGVLIGSIDSPMGVAAINDSKPPMGTLMGWSKSLIGEPMDESKSKDRAYASYLSDDTMIGGLH
jgi:hypothetical protein